MLILSPKDVIDQLGNVGFVEDYYVLRHSGEQVWDINIVIDQLENFGFVEDYYVLRHSGEQVWDINIKLNVNTHT